MGASFFARLNGERPSARETKASFPNGPHIFEAACRRERLMSRHDASLHAADKYPLDRPPTSLKTSSAASVERRGLAITYAASMVAQDHQTIDS